MTMPAARRGPSRLHWSRLLPVFAHPYRAYRRLHERHGDTLRVALPGRRRLWMTRDAAVIRRVLVAQHERLLRPRSVVRDIFEVTVGENIVASNGARWRCKRAQGEALLERTRTPARLEALEGCARELVEDVRAAAAGGRVELLPAVERFAVTVAARVVSGAGLARGGVRFQELEEALALIMRDTQRLADVRKRVFLFAATPRLGAWYEAPRVRRLRRMVERVASFEPDELTRELFMAAYENPSTTLAWAINFLARRPELVTRLRAEARAAGVLETSLREEQIDALRLADAVVRETARLRPPIAYLIREARVGLRLGELEIAEGDQVMIVPWVVHTDASRWRQPDHFDPDRFLGDPAGRGALLSFGLGPRACVGARFATRVLRVAVASLARAIDWSPAPGSRAPEPSGRFPWSEKVACTVRARAR